MEYLKVTIKTLNDSNGNYSIIQKILDYCATETIEEQNSNIVIQVQRQRYYDAINYILNNSGVLYATATPIETIKDVEPYKNIVAICYECNGYIYESNDSVTIYDGNTICWSCYNDYYNECNECNEVHRTNYLNETHDGNLICNRCLDNFYFTCDQCDEIYSTDECNEHDGEYYCDECYNQIIDIEDEEPSDGNLLQGYHSHNRNFSHILHYGRNDNEIKTIGFELETERGSSAIPRIDYCNKINNRINKDYKMVHFETDGSLDNGVEIISEPMTLEYWNDQKDKKIKDLIELCKSLGYQSHNGGRCGLHVHFNKKWFGSEPSEQQNKLNTLYLFFETYQNEITKLSRRERFDYCQFLSKKNYDLNRLSDAKIKHDIATSISFINRQKTNTSHGDAINANASTGATFEVRIMRGTLKYETFIACIEFIINMVECIANEPRETISFSKVVNYKPSLFLKQYINEREIKANYKKIKDSTDKLQKTAIAINNKIEKMTKQLTNLITSDLSKKVQKTKTIKTAMFTSDNKEANVRVLQNDANSISALVNTLNDIAHQRYYDANDNLIYNYNGNSETIEKAKETLKQLQQQSSILNLIKA